MDSALHDQVRLHDAPVPIIEVPSSGEYFKSDTISNIGVGFTLSSVFNLYNVH